MTSTLRHIVSTFRQVWCESIFDKSNLPTNLSLQLFSFLSNYILQFFLLSEKKPYALKDGREESKLIFFSGTKWEFADDDDDKRTLATRFSPWLLFVCLLFVIFLRDSWQLKWDLKIFSPLQNVQLLIEMSKRAWVSINCAESNAALG